MLFGAGLELSQPCMGPPPSWARPAGTWIRGELPEPLWCWPDPDRRPWLSAAPTHHRQREAHEHHDGVVEHHEELLVQVASRHGPDAPRGSGPPFVPSMPLDLVLVPVTEEHGIDVIDEVGHSKLRISRGKPVSVGQRKEESGRSRRKGEGQAAARCPGPCQTCPGNQVCVYVCLFTAEPAAYGHFPARDRIGAAAAGLHQSPSNGGI